MACPGPNPASGARVRTRGLSFPKDLSPNRPVLSEEMAAKMTAVAKDVDWRFAVAFTWHMERDTADFRCHTSLGAGAREEPRNSVGAASTEDRVFRRATTLTQRRPLETVAPDTASVTALGDYPLRWRVGFV